MKHAAISSFNLNPLCPVVSLCPPQICVNCPFLKRNVLSNTRIKRTMHQMTKEGNFETLPKFMKKG
jgi:hypothetical protein